MTSSRVTGEFRDGAAEPRCTLTELPVSGCAHCRDRVRGHRALRDRMHRMPRPQESFEVHYTFAARFAGRCAACDEPFPKDEEIGVTGYGQYICGECR